MRYFEFTFIRATDEYEYPEGIKIPIYGATLFFEHRLYKTDSHSQGEALSYGNVNRLRKGVSSALPDFSIAEISEEEYAQKLKDRTKTAKATAKKQLAQINKERKAAAKAAAKAHSEKDSVNGDTGNSSASEDARGDNDHSDSGRRHEVESVN